MSAPKPTEDWKGKRLYTDASGNHVTSFIHPNGQIEYRTIKPEPNPPVQRDYKRKR